MEAKSPTVSVKSREVIGGEQFNTRREIFDKHDTVFLPASPTSTRPTYVEVERIITSNHGKTTANFRRNAPKYASMREPREPRDEDVEFRVRKYSDNFTSEHNQSDYPEYRASQIERNRRLSKLRRDFLANTLQEPAASPLARSGVRATMPARAASLNYKLEGPKLVNFPFLEPYGTPPPARKQMENTDGPTNKDKENQDPEQRPSSNSTPETPGKVDQQKLFEDLVKRYSPQRKPVDWTLPPTKPRIVDCVHKSTSESTGSAVSKLVNGDDNVFDKEAANDVKANEGDSTTSAERAENNDRVPELVHVRKESDKPVRRHTGGEPSELTMPALIDKITAEGKELESHTNDKVKIKKKRSFIDKLLGRKKGTKTK